MRGGIIALGLIAGCGRISFDHVLVATGDPAALYASTFSTLFEIDPLTLQPTTAVVLICSTGPQVRVGDIAIDREGDLLAVDLDSPRLLRIDAETGECLVTPLGGATVLNGLVFVPPGVVDPVRETLLATSVPPSSHLVRVDVATGATHDIGALGMPASGDLAWTGSQLLVSTAISATMTDPDLLAVVDLATGVATPVGDTTYPTLFGLAWYQGNLVAFSTGGVAGVLDPATGAPVRTVSNGQPWTGAASGSTP